MPRAKEWSHRADSAPSQPSIKAVLGQTAFFISWDALSSAASTSSTGAPSIISFSVRYRVAGSSGAYSTITIGNPQATSATVSSNLSYQAYEAQVAALSQLTPSSASGSSAPQAQGDWSTAQQTTLAECEWCFFFFLPR